MDKVRKPSNSVCYTSSPELYRIYSYKRVYDGRSRDNSVGIATSLRARRAGFDSRQRKQNFLFSIASIQSLGPTRPIQWMPRVLAQGVKRQGSWSWLLTSIYSWGKEWCSYTSTPPYAFMDKLNFCTFNWKMMPVRQYIPCTKLLKGFWFNFVLDKSKGVSCILFWSASVQYETYFAL
jgi:hypothetical protein